MNTDPRARRTYLLLMADTLRAQHPTAPFTEDDRIRLCRDIAECSETTTTEELLHATVRVTEPTTRGQYGQALLKAVSDAP